MKHSIYSFSAVLRALRKEANMSPEEAAVLTNYPNYKRWELGRTAVKSEYLELIADAFEVDDDLWLLVYAWLVDRLTPGFGQPSADVGQQLKDLSLMMPDRLFDAGPGAGVASVPVSHAQFAAACLVARYGPGPGVTDVPMMLAAKRRSRIPWPIPPDVSALMFLYGDLYSDWVQYSSLTAILAGLGQTNDELRDAVVRETMTAMLSPSFGEELASLVAASPVTGDERGFDRLPGIAAGELDPITACLPRVRDELRRLQDAIAREPMTEEQFLSTFLDLMNAGPEAFLAEDCPIDFTKTPDLDWDLVEEGRVIFDRMDRDIRGAVSEELIEAAETANPAAAVEAIVRVRRDRQ